MIFAVLLRNLSLYRIQELTMENGDDWGSHNQLGVAEDTHLDAEAEVGSKDERQSFVWFAWGERSIRSSTHLRCRGLPLTMQASNLLDCRFDAEDSNKK